MTPATELHLAELDITSPALWADPMPYVAAARRTHPWLARSPAGLVLTDYRGIKDLLGMDDRLRPPNAMITHLMNAQDTRWGRWNNEFLLATSGDKHKRLRGLVASTFSPKSANAQRPLIRAIVGRLLDEWAPKGRFEFVDFASFFPITVLCGLIGAPPDVVPGIKDSLEILGTGFDLDPGLTPKLETAFSTLWDFVDGLVTERRAHPRTKDEPSDLLDALIAANLAGDRLTDTELYDLLILLFGGGYDTSKNLLGMIMHLLVDRPDDWARVAHDQPYANKVIEEALRHSAVVTSYRVTNDDLSYRDVILPKDTMVILSTVIAGRDEDAYADALRFDPERAQEPRHIAFGRGAHLCLGQFIARAQVEEGLPLIAQRLLNPRRDGQEAWRPLPGVWGLSRLPIAFDPAPDRP